MSSLDSEKDEQKSYIKNLVWAAFAGQFGCLILVVIVIGAVLLGLWLDNQFDTKPIITLIFVFGILPIILVLMFWGARIAAGKIKFQTSSKLEEDYLPEEENNFG